MIVDNIKNAGSYALTSDSFERAFELLGDAGLADQAAGKYEVDENMFYLVNRYASKPAEECKLETHEKYIDIQYICSGSEIIGYCPAEKLEVMTPYNVEKDIAFYHTPAEFTKIVFEPGMFGLFLPQDGHKPGCMIAGPQDVVKIVVKIKINN